MIFENEISVLKNAIIECEVSNLLYGNRKQVTEVEKTLNKLLIEVNYEQPNKKDIEVVLDEVWIDIMVCEVKIFGDNILYIEKCYNILKELERSIREKINIPVIAENTEKNMLYAYYKK